MSDKKDPVRPARLQDLPSDALKETQTSRRGILKGTIALGTLAATACRTTDDEAKLQANDQVTTFGPASEEGGGGVVSTQAVGEEGGGPVTTQAVGEEGGNGNGGPTTFGPAGEEAGGDAIATTLALNEEGGDQRVTTFGPAGEEAGNDGGRVTTFGPASEEGGGGQVSTQAVGEEGGGVATTQAVGEEGGGQVTTFGPASEEGGGGQVSTQAVGEEGGGQVTTQAVGEEGGDDEPKLTTFGPAGEEAGTDEDNRVTTFGPAGEESGQGRLTTQALGEEGGDGNFVTTKMVGEEGGQYFNQRRTQGWTAISRAISQANTRLAKLSCGTVLQLLSVEHKQQGNKHKYKVWYLEGTKTGLNKKTLDVENSTSETPKKLQSRVLKLLIQLHGNC